MSFSKRLRILAVGAVLASPTLQAQTEKSSDKAPTPITQTAQSSWPWTEGFSSAELRATYDSLPKEYKAFANKTFMERAEMREEWEQRDFIKRDKKYQKEVREGKHAHTFGAAEGDLEMHILKDRFNGKLSPSQALLATDLVKYGRPLSTIDTHKPFADQLRSCGFDVYADVIAGQRESTLSPRDKSLLVWQIQEADALTDIGQNREAWREFQIRSQKEENEEYEKSSNWFSRLFASKTRYLTAEEMAKDPTQFEKINGKEIVVPKPNQLNYSIRDEITRKVGQKIATEQQALVQKLKSQPAPH